MSCWRQWNSLNWSPSNVTDEHFACQDPSNGFVSCCRDGDFCMENQICMEGSLGTPKYYTSACTDPDFRHPACNRDCATYRVPDISFDADRGLWFCCGTADNTNSSELVPTCDSPTDTSFSAPSPEELAAAGVGSISSDSLRLPTGAGTAISASSATPATTSNNQQPVGQSSQSISTSNTISTSSATAATTSTDEQPVGQAGQSTLSTGAKAGIGVVSGVCALLILGALLWIGTRFRLTRKRSSSAPKAIATPYPDQKFELAAQASSPRYQEKPKAFAELPVNGLPCVGELPADGRERVELGGR